MKITYERLVNLGNFNNERLSLEDDVQPGETPEEAYQRVRATVYALLGITDPKAPRPAMRLPDPNSAAAQIEAAARGRTFEADDEF